MKYIKYLNSCINATPQSILDAPEIIANIVDRTGQRMKSKNNACINLLVRALFQEILLFIINKIPTKSDRKSRPLIPGDNLIRGTEANPERIINNM